MSASTDPAIQRIRENLDALHSAYFRSVTGREAPFSDDEMREYGRTVTAAESELARLRDGSGMSLLKLSLAGAL